MDYKIRYYGQYSISDPLFMSVHYKFRWVKFSYFEFYSNLQVLSQVQFSLILIIITKTFFFNSISSTFLH